MKIRYSSWIGVLSVSSLLAGFAGCAQPVAPEDQNEPGGRAGSGPGGGGNGGEAGTKGGSSAPRNERPSATDPDPSKTVPGVDAPLDVEPSGCLGGAAGGALSLTLDAAVRAVLIEGTGGKLIANGVACTDAGGAELPLAELRSLEITGGADDNGVILDLGSGDFSALLALPESIELDLGTGSNGLLVRGTSGADSFRHGMRGASLVLALSAPTRVSLLAEGVSELGVSLGAGDDELAPFTGNPALTALSVPLAAYGDLGNDRLTGGSSDDVFDGGPGDDMLDGLGGDDIFWASGELDGHDTYNGGPGYDYISYDLRSASLALNACVSSGEVGCAEDECACEPSGEADEQDLIVNIEDITAGSGDDVLRGTDVAESLSGGPGDDTLHGLGGTDVLYGERGADVLDGGDDADYCDGGTSDEMLSCEL